MLMATTPHHVIVPGPLIIQVQMQTEQQQKVPRKKPKRQTVVPAKPLRLLKKKRPTPPQPDLLRTEGRTLISTDNQHGVTVAVKTEIKLDCPVISVQYAGSADQSCNKEKKGRTR